MRRLARVPIGALLAALFIYLIAIDIDAAIPNDRPRDFDAVYASGMAAASGLAPGAIYSPAFLGRLGGVDVRIVNANPPVSALFFQPLASIPHHEAFRLWYGISVALYGAMILLLAIAYRTHFSPLRFMWLLWFAGFWDILNMGQIYIPFALAGAAAWLLLRSGRQVPAGLLVGVIVAIKPHFAVWPALLLLGGAVPAALSAGVVAAILTAVPVVAYGPSVYLGWLGVLQSGMAVHLPNNASLLGIASRLGAPWAGILLSVALLSFLALLVTRYRPPVQEVSGIALVASLLASPVAWVTYTVFLLPIFLSRPWSRAMAAAAVLLVVPVPVVWSGAQTSTVALVAFGSIYTCALLLALGSLVGAQLRSAGVTMLPMPLGATARGSVPSSRGRRSGTRRSLP